MSTKLVALDRVLAVEPGECARALRNVPNTLSFFDSHFPLRPVLPGVMVIGSMGVNPGFQLVNNKQNPQIADEYQRGFKVMHSLPCDVPLGSHPAMYSMAEKYAKIGKGPNPFVDPEGYRTELDINENVFKRTLDEQRKAGGK